MYPRLIQVSNLAQSTVLTNQIQFWSQPQKIQNGRHQEMRISKLQIKVTKNHIIPRFVVFSRHETVRERFVLYKVKVTQKKSFSRSNIT